LDLDIKFHYSFAVLVDGNDLAQPGQIIRTAPPAPAPPLV
jgi:hypothetical protein